MTIVKTISIKQPWANMIADNIKTIETRTWKTKYRGPLLIVSCLNPPIRPAGHGVAICDLVDCRPMTEADEHMANCHLYPDAWAWMLENIRKIKPFPVKGQLGIYQVEPPYPLE